MTAFFRLTALSLLLLVAAPLTHAQSAPDLRPMARQLAKDLGEAIISVRIVLSLGSGGDSREIKSEGNATVLGPDGLAVISISSVDPISMFKQMNPEGEERMGSFESRVKDLRYILPDRTEVPATIVLRDADLNIAFLRPLQKPTKPMKFVDLKQAGTADILDPFVMLARLGPVADRQMSVQSGVIESVVSKPRKFYVPGGAGGLNALAVPTFDADGKVLGLMVIRVQIGGNSDEGFSMMGEGNDRMLPIILPAEDVAEVAAQAPMEGEKLGDVPAKGSADKKKPASDDAKTTKPE